MPETKSRFLKDIIDKAPESKAFTSERQHTAQAFNLHVARKDGRQSEGFAWSHYVGYEWTDKGEIERLVVLFGTRAIEIEGHHLGALVDEIREGQLNGILELTASQGTLMAQGSGENEPVITSVKTYPAFEDILKDLKGDDKDENRFTRKFER